NKRNSHDAVSLDRGQARKVDTAFDSSSSLVAAVPRDRRHTPRHHAVRDSADAPAHYIKRRQGHAHRVRNLDSESDASRSGGQFSYAERNARTALGRPADRNTGESQDKICPTPKHSRDWNSYSIISPKEINGWNV